MTTRTTSTHEGHRKRLRQKFASAGLEPFLDHEVLELLLTYAIARKDTKPLSWALLKKFGSLSAVLDAPKAQLLQVPGVGEQTACFLQLVRAIFKRYSLGHVKKEVVIRSPQQVLEYCKASLAGKKEESLELIFLSVKSTVIGTQIISSGMIDRVAVTPRKIIEGALLAKAKGIILVHNHPSGDATPSQEDIQLTRETIAAAQLFDISVRDHIIVGARDYYSLRLNGDI